jgi:hypothetical protein
MHASGFARSTTRLNNDMVAGSGLNNDVVPRSGSFCSPRRRTNACADRRPGGTAYYATRGCTSASADCRPGRRILRH